MATGRKTTEIASKCRLSLSDARHLFFLQVLATQRMRLETRVPSEKTARAMTQARKIRRQFDSIDDMLRASSV